MSENISPVITTLDRYVPAKFRRHVIAVGTAGLVLQGVRMPVPVADVDVLAPIDFIEELEQGMLNDRVEDTSYFDPHGYDDIVEILDDPTGRRKGSISLTPNDRHPELLPFQAFFGIRDDRHHMNLPMAEEVAIRTPSGYRALPATSILEWKASVSRPKDIEFAKRMARAPLNPGLQPSTINEQTS